MAYVLKTMSDHMLCACHFIGPSQAHLNTIIYMDMRSSHYTIRRSL